MGTEIDKMYSNHRVQLFFTVFNGSFAILSYFNESYKWAAFSGIFSFLCFINFINCLNKRV